MSSSAPERPPEGADCGPGRGGGGGEPPPSAAAGWAFLPRSRPVSFIFVGPTGVGKTELVKCWPGEMFDSVEP